MTDNILWSWQHAVIKSDLQPTTRHVLLTLGLYMNKLGGGCYPTISALCEATGLSNKAVCTHLEKAANRGWISRSKHGFKGQKWANNEYRATFPEGSELGSPASQKVVNEVPKGSEPNDKKVVNEVHTTSPVYQTNNHTPQPPQGACEGNIRDWFERLWQSINPKLPKTRRGNKEGAYKIFLRLAKTEGLEPLNAAVRGFYASQEVSKQNYKYAPGIKTCLSGKKYEGFLGPPEKSSAATYLENRLAAHRRAGA